MSRGKKFKNKTFIYSAAVVAIPLLIYFMMGAEFSSVSYDNNDSSDSGSEKSESAVIDEQVENSPAIQYVKTPDPLKGIYMTACVAGTPSFRANLVDLINSTELNSVVIDIKDFSGTISFAVSDPDYLTGVRAGGCRVSDMREFISELHDLGIYVIGRITVFQDPFYSQQMPELAVKKASNSAIWEDYKGISFIEVGAKKYWDYILALTKESHAIGFDEINFDYVRFPSDGNMKDIYFPFSESLINSDPEDGKAIALENFFKYLKSEIDKYNSEILNNKDAQRRNIQPLVTSVDLFGMVTTNTDDLNIGQVLERALPYFDFVAPMVYPSHYPSHFNGWVDPNTVPYDLIYFVMSEGARRADALASATSTPAEVRDHVSADQLRPWLQDFDYGGNYDVAEVRAQIKATYDAGLDSWMLWAASNRYTRGALDVE